MARLESPLWLGSPTSFPSGGEQKRKSLWSGQLVGQPDQWSKICGLANSLGTNQWSGKLVSQPNQWSGKLVKQPNQLSGLPNLWFSDQPETMAMKTFAKYEPPSWNLHDLIFLTLIQRMLLSLHWYDNNANGLFQGIGGN